MKKAIEKGANISITINGEKLSDWLERANTEI
jgi:hypothetical protein